MHSTLFSTPLGFRQVIKNILCLGIVFYDNYRQLDSVVLTFNGSHFYHIYFNHGSLAGYFYIHCFQRLFKNTSFKWKRFSFFSFTQNKICSLLLSTKKKIIFGYLTRTELYVLKPNPSQVWLWRCGLPVSSLLQAGSGHIGLIFYAPSIYLSILKKSLVDWT